MNDITLTPLSRISTNGGDVLRVLRSTEKDFKSIEEAYFSWIESGLTKAWKLHRQITSNIVVPFGRVMFVFLNSDGAIRTEEIGEQNYNRLTIPPGVWFGFKGLAEHPSLILNLADAIHNPNEVERKAITEVDFDWGTI